MSRTRSESIAHYAILNALWISLTVQDTALMTIAVPAAVNHLAPATHVESLAFLVAMSNLAAMLVPPIAGWFSDRHRKQTGGLRRRWVVAGVAVDVCALVAIVFTHTLVAFDVLFVIAVAAENVAIAAYQAMIPEIVPREAWGAASGLRGAATLIGTVAGLSIAGSIGRPDVVFLGAALLLALGLFSLLALNERDYIAPEPATVVRWHDFIVVFLARAFVFFGLTLLMTFVLYFFQDVLHYKNPSQGTAFVGVCSLVGAIVSSVLLGVLSDRVSRKVIAALCGIPMAIAAAGFAAAPNANVILISAVFFGAGLGGILSVGWALAFDSLPALSNIARDLGIWGMATNLPAVIAPLIGGWIVHEYGGARAGYQVIFGLAGVSFALGSLTVLRVGARPISSLLTMPVWIAAMSSVYFGMHSRHRVRSFGRLKRNRGGTLIVVNHQTELEAMVVVSGIGMHSSWRHPIFAASGGRMWEPGFFAVRFPWLYTLMRRVSMAPLFRALGLMRIENELGTRALSSIALIVKKRHGDDVLLRDVVTGDVAGRFPADMPISELWRRKYFAAAQDVVKLSKVREPYRAEVIADTREQLDADVAAMEDVVSRGATFYLTPEGRYSTDGELLPLRGLLPRLLNYAKTIYVCGVSYDVFRGKKTSVLYHLAELRDRNNIEDELRAARPVTITQLLGTWLSQHAKPFTAQEAIGEVERALGALPASLFVDPEVKRNPQRVTREALETMVREELLTLDGAVYRIARRSVPLFPNTDDIFAYQMRFLAQSVQAATSARRS
ncbi:MAG: MFS transporter [Candidatus Eremiobacteraeota bacterium]|nr:MFS transporter [Candidatus Eremiobacteraeota bacterium]